MIRIIFITLMLSVAYSQCDDYNQFQCSNDESCNWVEDIQYGSCSNLGSSSCDATPGCWGAYTNPGWYYGWYCAGGNYQIDNSYCEEVQLPECSEMGYNECSNSDGCNWVEDFNYYSCGNFNQSE